MNGIIKRISASVVAACMGVAMVIPINASAYICGDVNNDGIVSMLDKVSLDKYLAGMIELAHYEAADVTDNGVINVVDSLVLMRHLTGDRDFATLPHIVTTE